MHINHEKKCLKEVAFLKFFKVLVKRGKNNRALTKNFDCWKKYKEN
jgi:hypothetical protein